MKAKLTIKQMPPHVYVYVRNYQFCVDPVRTQNIQQMYVRADLYEKARAEIKRLREIIKTMEE